jgi:DNA-binding MarR family transcriptional regulator
MPQPTAPASRTCHCMMVRKAARVVTQFYDRRMAETGLTTSQFSILSQIGRRGAINIHSLAEALVMDRTTMSRTLAPLAAAGLVSIEADPKDRRARAVRLTQAGSERVAAAREPWRRAQLDFESAYGEARSEALGQMMADLVATAFPASS